MSAPVHDDHDDSSQRAALRELLPELEADPIYAQIEQIRSESRVFGGEPMFDRYTLCERIDRGGMGVVYRVYDPKFERHFALKVLTRRLTNDPTTSPGAQLFGEAQALLLVHGEHVVRVYDTGLFHDHPWFVMEYVEGSTLAQWLASAPRRWPEIVARFVEAAHGLRAVHRAGLVHRDFKPQNVVIKQPGDHAMVIDFGLAEPLTEVSTSSLDQTEPSGVLPRKTGGTLPFVAPEQRAGRAIGPASDQYSFFVALYWALYSEHPYPKGPQRPHIIPSRPACAGERGIPRWLHRVICRGLAEAPEHRFKSMTQVIDELTRDRGRKLRLAASATTVFAGGLASALLFLPTTLDLAKTCSEPATEVRELIAQAKISLTPEIGASLQRFGERWERHYRDACEAHHIRGEAGLELRRRCLVDGQQELEFLLQDMPTWTSEQVRRAVESLGDPALCDAEVERPIGDEAQRRGVAEVRASLAHARVVRASGDYAAAFALANTAVEQARLVNHAPTTAEALHMVATLERDRGDADRALTNIESATREAGRGRTAFTAIAALHELARMELLDQEDARRGDLALAFAGGRLAGLGWDVPPTLPCPAEDGTCLKHAMAWAEHQDLSGHLAYLELDYSGSITHHAGALAVWQALRSSGDRSEQIHAAMLNLGRSQLHAGEFDAAEKSLVESLALGEQMFGVDNPMRAECQLDLALLWSRRGDPARADATAAKAAELYAKRQTGPSLGVARAELLRAVIALAVGYSDTARTHATRASTLFAQLPQAPTAESLQARQIVAVSLWADERCEAAAPLLRALVGDYSQRPEPRWQCDAALTGAYLGECLQTPEAEQVWQAAADALERAGGAARCIAGYQLHRTRGDRAHADKDHRAAVGHYEQALQVGALDPLAQAEIEWNLAQNLVLEGGDVNRSVTLARKARAVFVEVGDSQEELAMIDAWLGQHSPD